MDNYELISELQHINRVMDELHKEWLLDTIEHDEYIILISYYKTLFNTTLDKLRY